jgi:hypothetical protein
MGHTLRKVERVECRTENTTCVMPLCKENV